MFIISYNKRFETFLYFFFASITTSLEKFIRICVRAACVVYACVSVLRACLSNVIFKRKKKKTKVLLPVEYRNIPCVF